MFTAISCPGEKTIGQSIGLEFKEGARTPTHFTGCLFSAGQRRRSDYCLRVEALSFSNDHNRT